MWLTRSLSCQNGQQSACKQLSLKKLEIRMQRVGISQENVCRTYRMCCPDYQKVISKPNGPTAIHWRVSENATSDLLGQCLSKLTRWTCCAQLKSVDRADGKTEYSGLHILPSFHHMDLEENECTTQQFGLDAPLHSLLDRATAVDLYED